MKDLKDPSLSSEQRIVLAHEQLAANFAAEAAKATDPYKKRCMEAASAAARERAAFFKKA